MRRLFIAIAIALVPSLALAAPDEVYVAYSTGNDTTGDGTSGTPWATIQKALNTVNHGGDGVRINVKAGETQILSAILSYTTYVGTNGVGAVTEPLIIQGYTSAAGDGGIATIQGTTNSVAIWGGTDSLDADFVTFQDLIMTSGQASGYAIDIDNNCTLRRCKLVSPKGGIDIDTNSNIRECWVSYGAALAVNGGATTMVSNTYFESTGSTFIGGVVAIVVKGCVFNSRAGTTDAATYVISPAGWSSAIIGNTILGNISSGTAGGHGIRIGHNNCLVENNYIEGFAGTNSEGIDISSSSHATIVEGNKTFNCTSGMTNASATTMGQTSISNLGASGVTNASGGDYSPTSDLIDAGVPAAFFQLSGNANYPTVGAIETQHGSTNTIDPLTGTIPGL